MYFTYPNFLYFTYFCISLIRKKKFFFLPEGVQISEDVLYIEAHQHEDKTSSEGFEMHLHADQIIQLIYRLSFVPFINLGLVRPRVRPSNGETGQCFYPSVELLTSRDLRVLLQWACQEVWLNYAVISGEISDDF